MIKASKMKTVVGASAKANLLLITCLRLTAVKKAAKKISKN